MTEKLVELIAQVKGDSSIVNTLQPSSSLLDEVGLDSLQLINLMLLVESEFGIEFDFDSFQIDHLRSLERFSEYVCSLTQT